MKNEETDPRFLRIKRRRERLAKKKKQADERRQMRSRPPKPPVRPAGKPTLRVKYTNGVGNNLFQYFYARLIATEWDMLLNHRGVPELGIAPEINEFNPGYPVKSVVGSSKIPFDYGSLLAERQDVNLDLDVYPEDFTVYLNRIDKVRGWMPPPTYANEDDLVLHLRLGDRLVMSSTFKDGNDVPADEFVKAINSFKFDRLHVVTDMPVWSPVTPQRVAQMKFHRAVKAPDRATPVQSAAYFNSLYAALQQYDPIVRCGNPVGEDFDYMRSFKKVMFQHGTLAWWAAALGRAEEVALYGRWRSNKKINLGWTPFPGWRQWGPLTAPPRDVKEWHLLQLAKQYNLHTFVETGTRGATTLLAMEPYFRKLYSVEIIEQAYQNAVRKTAGHPKMKLYLGDSAEQIAHILEQVKEPALFWLDAHDGKFSTPVLMELSCVMLHQYPHVVAMDDYRYFESQDAYPTLGQVKELVHRIKPGAVVDVKFDSIRVFPGEPKK